MLRVGVVGAGRWAHELADGLRRAGDLRLDACYSRRACSREQFAGTFGCRPVSSLEALLCDREIDAVILATPNSVHREQAVAAALHRKHVFVEKPLADSVEQGMQIVETCRREGVTLMVGHNSRRRVEFRYMKAAIGRAELGEVTSAECSYSRARGLGLTAGDWRFSSSECPGGPLIQLGIHHVDTMNYLLGSPQTVFSFQERLYTPAEIPDTTMTVIRYASGRLAYVGSVYVSVPTYRVALYGTKACLVYDECQGLTAYGEAGVQSPVGPPSDAKSSIAASITEQFEEFARCVESSELPETGGTEGLVALAVVEAANLSSDLMRPVAVEHILANHGRGG